MSSCSVLLEVDGVVASEIYAHYQHSWDQPNNKSHSREQICATRFEILWKAFTKERTRSKQQINANCFVCILYCVAVHILLAMCSYKNVSWHNTKTQSKCQKYITSIGGYFIHTYAGFLTICCTLYWKIFYIDSAAQTLISLVHQGQCVNNEDSREMKEENIKVGVELKLL